MREIAEETLESLALGAAVLGTGGGGDPYIGKLLARNAILEHGPVEVLDLDEVPDDALCAMSAVMGAPTVLVEKLPGGGEQLAALGALEDYLGRKATHILCAEVGGLNSMLPIAAATATGLPLVDCDAMGRAFPEIQMSTPTLFSVGASPMAMADEKGNIVVIDAVDNHWTERMARSIAIDMGATAFISLYSQTGEQAKQAMIGGTLSIAESIGAAILTARDRKEDPIDSAAREMGGFLIYVGKIAEVERRTEAGFARGSVTIEGLAAHSGTEMRIEFQNENLVATRASEVVATVPDLITVLDLESGEPITTEELRYGYRVGVIAAPCDNRWRTDSGLELVGPRYFGYDIPYVPVEERVVGKTDAG